MENCITNTYRALKLSKRMLQAKNFIGTEVFTRIDRKELNEFIKAIEPIRHSIEHLDEQFMKTGAGANVALAVSSPPFLDDHAHSWVIEAGGIKLKVITVKEALEKLYLLNELLQEKGKLSEAQILALKKDGTVH